MKNWTTLTAFMLILLIAGAADGLMDALGPTWFLIVSIVVMSVAGALVNRTQQRS